MAVTGTAVTQQLQKCCLQPLRQTGVHISSQECVFLPTVGMLSGTVGNMAGHQCCRKCPVPGMQRQCNITDVLQVAEQLEHQGGRILWRVRSALQMRFQLPSEVPRDVADALSKPIAVAPRVLKGKRTSGGDLRGTRLPAMDQTAAPLHCWVRARALQLRPECCTCSRAVAITAAPLHCQTHHDCKAPARH